MSFRLLFAPACALALLAALAASAATPARATTVVPMPERVVLPASPNRTDARRTARSIRQIVVHVTEGGFVGSVGWLRNPKTHVSAHFVISRTGEIAQLVDLQDVAWHAGNRRTNFRSIGIEHEGWTYGSGFPQAQVRASARLLAALATRYRIPLDRRHVIGHDEVPDPGNPWLAGGASNHTDPGPHWDWNRYLALARATVRAAQPLAVDSPGIRPGTVLRGRVRWQARTSPNVRSVAFLVDGRVLWQDRVRPFTFGRGRGLPSTQLTNGRHVLELRASAGSRSVTRRIDVSVDNASFRITTAGARKWGKARGHVKLRVRPWNAKARKVVLLIDGRRAAADGRAPFTFRWNTRLRRDGKHVLTFVATARDGRRATQRIPVVVSNRPRPKAKPKRTAPVLTLAAGSIRDGATLSGFTVWRADVRGRAARVEFLVDGAVRGADVAAPYTIGLDPASAPAGPHTLTVRAVGADGRVAERSATVVFAPAAP